MHMLPKSLPDIVNLEIWINQGSLTRECIASTGDQLGTIASLTLDTLVKIIGGLPKPHENDESRCET
jgi:hypothetical protein